MIFMEEYAEGHPAMRLRCSHIVGSSCLTKWAENKQTCPACRCPFLSPAERKLRGLVFRDTYFKLLGLLKAAGWLAKKVYGQEKDRNMAFDCVLDWEQEFRRRGAFWFIDFTYSGTIADEHPAWQIHLIREMEELHSTYLLQRIEPALGMDR
jgi:hypothetical protein